MNDDSKQPISNNIIHKPLFIIIGKLPTSRQCKKEMNDENPQLKNAIYFIVPLVSVVKITS